MNVFARKQQKMEFCPYSPVKWRPRVSVVLVVSVFVCVAGMLAHYFVVAYHQNRIREHESMLRATVTNLRSEKDVVAKLGTAYLRLEGARAVDFFARFSDNPKCVAEVGEANAILVYKQQDVLYFILLDETGHVSNYFVVNN